MSYAVSIRRANALGSIEEDKFNVLAGSNHALIAEEVFSMDNCHTAEDAHDRGPQSAYRRGAIGVVTSRVPGGHAPVSSRTTHPGSYKKAYLQGTFDPQVFGI
jgi:hypothetical protein